MSRGNLVIFFVPPEKTVNGGIMSIFSLCEESRQFYDLHRSKVVLCTYPGHATYNRNDLFPNRETVYNFDQVIAKWPRPNTVLFHIPETAIRIAYRAFRGQYKDYIKTIPHIHINVLTQNIDLARQPAEFAELFRFTPAVTQTAAHIRYATQQLSNLYQTPVHHMSVFIDKGQYRRVPFSKKENLIIYSPDNCPGKQQVLDNIQSISGYTTREIRDLTYDEYKDLAARAKFCITFGEGFDGYFIESYLSGSIGIAVYNERFFPDKSYLNIPSVFTSYEQMARDIRNTILKLDQKATFERYVRSGASMIERLYSRAAYLQKVRRFYQADYDFRPEAATATALIVSLLDARDQTLRDQETKYRTTMEHERQYVDTLRRQLRWSLLFRASQLAKRLRRTVGQKR